jgi:hypothetical protein
MSHRVCLNAYTGDAQLLALDKGGARPAEWVENLVMGVCVETFEVLADQVRGKERTKRYHS